MSSKDKSLKTKTIHGFFWSFVSRFIIQIITFIVGIILARILSPKEFGLIGMLSVFISFSQIIINSGFNEALIRKKDTTEDDFNTVFIFNLFVSFILYIILIFSADWIAHFYDQPELKLLIKVLSLGLIINSLSIVQFTKIRKRIDFKSITKVEIVSSVGSGIVAIFLALLGYGVWSLVWKTLSENFLRGFYVWKINKWFPKFKFNKKSFKELFSFGGKLMINGIIGAVFKNSYILIIGKFYNANILGQFTRAEAFKNLPILTLTGIVQSVSYPVLAEIQNNKEKLQMAYRRLIKSTMLITITGMFILSVIAEKLTILLIGPQWEIAGEYLKIFCFSGIFFPLDALNSSMLKIMNRSDLILKIGIWRKILAIPLFIVIIYFGIKPFLYFLILHQVISFLMISNYSKSYINYGTLNQIIDILPFLIIGIISILIITLIGNSFEWNSTLTIVIQLLAGVAFTMLVLEISKDDTFFYMKSVIKEYVTKNNKNGIKS